MNAETMPTFGAVTFDPVRSRESWRGVFGCAVAGSNVIEFPRRPATLVHEATLAPDAPALRKPRRLVAIESPYAGEGERNLAYVRAAMRHAFMRDEAPYASHALYTQPGVLDDTIPAERALGIDAGFDWATLADVRAFYLDLGWSSGMRKALADAESIGQRIEYRAVPGWKARATA